MASPKIEKALLYVRTVARMRPSMVAARLRRTELVPEASEGVALRPMGLSVPELDLDEGYCRRFDLDGLARGEFLLINERHTVDLEAWNAPEASHLWNFNLHYFEFCVPLAARFARTGDAADEELFKRLVSSWIDACEYPHGDAWHPYTISLRLVNWLICLDLFGESLAGDGAFMARLSKSMYRQYHHLLANQEKHLLANHYLENLKTLVICALAFGEDDVLAEVERDYLAQLDEQVPPDGVHYERSMMYHKLILEGLLRVELAYLAAGKASPQKIAAKAKLMLDAMASIERGMGKTPFFNDSADGVAKECGALVEACRRVYGLEPDDSKTAFPDSGFYKLYDGDAALVFFAGEPGPRYMLGHAHCDLLSFELSVVDKPVIVNSGTYAYQSEMRPYFRSTAAHNTAAIDGEEQMECWAEHRVARGVSDVRVEEVDGHRIVASFRNFRGHLHRRSVELRDGVLAIVDSTDRADAEVAQHFHLAAEALEEGFEALEGGAVSEGGAAYSPEFGVIGEIPDLKVTGRGSVASRFAYGKRRA